LILLGRALFVLSAAASATTTAGLSHQEVESALTERYQTTVPQPVRQALGLLKRDRIRYTVRANGEVVLQRVSAEPADDDPALAPFLALLEQDIASHPDCRTSSLASTWISRYRCPMTSPRDTRPAERKYG
jgi:antitoxin PrlF